MLDGTIEGYESYEHAVAAQSSEPLDEDRVAGMDMLYSSGTTGRPKGVTRPFTAMPLETTPGSVAPILQMLFGGTNDSVYLSPAPFYHAAPLRFSMAAQALGATVVAMEHFDAEQYLALIDRYRVTVTQVVPTMFIRLLKLDPEVRAKYDVSSLRCVIHAAAPCPVAVKKQMIEWFGPVLHEYYAGTEGNGFVYCNSEMWLAHEGTVGTPINCVVHICGDDGEELPRGAAGTVYFEGGATFEYHNDAEKTAVVASPDGVEHARRCRLSRRRQLPVSHRSQGVHDHQRWCEPVSAGDRERPGDASEGRRRRRVRCAQRRLWRRGQSGGSAGRDAGLDDEAESLAKELMTFCRSQLADVKCPRSIDFREELPRHPTGKLYKRLLKDEYWRAAGRSI